MLIIDTDRVSHGRLIRMKYTPSLPALHAWPPIDSPVEEYTCPWNSLQAQQLPAEPGSLTAAVAMVNVCVELEDFIPVQQPVKLTPGPPVQLILNNGHPFENLVCSPCLCM